MAVGLLFFAVLVVVWLVSAPVQGHNTAVDVPIHKTTSKSAATAPATTPQTSYYRLSLPPGFHVQAASQSVDGLLSSQLLTKPGALGSLIINIAIKPLPDGGLDNDSSYRLRELQTSRYSLTSESHAGDTVHISNDQQSAAVVAFWPHGSYLATIGISSSIDNPATDDNADEIATLHTLLANWTWL